MRSVSSLDNTISSCFFAFCCSVGRGSCSFVEQMPWRSWSKWPLCIALEKKRCSLTWDDVILPGKACRIPASMALQKVDISGKKRFALKKAICAARCGSGHKALAAWDGAWADDELIVVCGSAACEKGFTVAASLYRAFEDLMSSAIQSCLLTVRVPLRTSLPFFVMVQILLLKYASQPSSHSFPT